MKLILPIYPLFSSSKPPLYSKMAYYFQKYYNYELVAITFGVNSRKYLKTKKNIQWKNIYDFQEYFINFSKNKLYPNDIEKLESIYGIPNFGMCITACQSILSNFKKKYNYDEIIKIIVTYIYFCESVFKKESQSFFIDEGIAGINSLIWKIAENYNIRVFNLRTSRIPNRFVITHNSFDKWDTVEKLFIEIKKRNLTINEKKEADNFLRKFKIGQLEPPYMKINKRSPSISVKAPLHFLQYLYQYYFLKEKENIFFQSPYYRIKNKIERIWKYNFLRLKKMWELPIEGEKYILYPLQFQPEASTLVLAPFYLDQLSVIENIAQSLPVNYKLYVKEHISSIGLRSLSYYKRILKIPNVRLISPWNNIHELIQNSNAIITISATTGWESILYEKPVILFGSAFYDIFDLVYKVKDINELPNIIKKAIFNFKPDRELMLKFIISVIKGTYEGEISMPLPYTYSEQNVKKLCDAIVKEIDSLNKGLYV